jgi:hypothetical protein
MSARRFKRIRQRQTIVGDIEVMSLLEVRYGGHTELAEAGGG